MLAPTDVVPERYEFTAIRGTTFRRAITLYTDEAKKNKRNLAGLGITLVIRGHITLTRGNGLEVVDAEGKITVVLKPSQTSAAPKEEHDMYLTISTNEPEDAIIPVDGLFVFPTP